MVGHGLRNLALAGLAIFTITTAVAAMGLNGQQSFFGTISATMALSLGMIAGAVLGGGFFLIGAVLLPIGLRLGLGAGWASYGVLIAVPVVVGLAIVGYAGWMNIRADAERPSLRTGSVSLVLEGQALGAITATGAASCSIYPDGLVTLDAGMDPDQPAFVTADGRPASVQLGLDQSGEVRSLAVQVGLAQALPGKGWDVGPDTVDVVAGSTTQNGGLQLSGLVPLGADAEPDPVERWGGTLSWDCRPGVPGRHGLTSRSKAMERLAPCASAEWPRPASEEQRGQREERTPPRLLPWLGGECLLPHLVRVIVIG